MSKRTTIAALLALALGSQAVLAQDMKSPAHPDPKRAAALEQQQSSTLTPEQQKRLDEYWATHNDDAPSYPLAP